MQRMPLRCQVFVLIGMLFISEVNKSLLEKKPTPCDHAYSSFQQWHSSWEREMCHLSGSTSRAEQAYRHTAHAECTNLPCPSAPRSIALSTAPWTCRSPLDPKLSQLSPLGGPKENTLGTSTLQKQKCLKKGYSDNHHCVDIQNYAQASHTPWV